MGAFEVTSITMDWRLLSKLGLEERYISHKVFQDYSDEPNLRKLNLTNICNIQYLRFSLYKERAHILGFHKGWNFPESSKYLEDFVEFWALQCTWSVCKPDSDWLGWWGGESHVNLATLNSYVPRLREHNHDKIILR